jgi:hypothetical protein
MIRHGEHGEAVHPNGSGMKRIGAAASSEGGVCGRTALEFGQPAATGIDLGVERRRAGCGAYSPRSALRPPSVPSRRLRVPNALPGCQEFGELIATFAQANPSAVGEAIREVRESGVHGPQGVAVVLADTRRILCEEPTPEP